MTNDVPTSSKRTRAIVPFGDSNSTTPTVAVPGFRYQWHHCARILITTPGVIRDDFRRRETRKPASTSERRRLPDGRRKVE
jgi:hypothetical protein